jgi:hypothetical protein
MRLRKNRRFTLSGQQIDFPLLVEGVHPWFRCGAAQMGLRRRAPGLSAIPAIQRDGRARIESLSLNVDPPFLCMAGRVLRRIQAGWSRCSIFYGTLSICFGFGKTPRSWRSCSGRSTI